MRILSRGYKRVINPSEGHEPVNEPVLNHERKERERKMDIKVEQKTEAKGGLEEVIAADSAICLLDGKRGILGYRGYSIKDLAEHASFEEVAYLLWFKRLPARKELDEFKRKLTSEGKLSAKTLALLKGAPAEANPMAVLRTAVSALALDDPLADDMGREANIAKATRLLAQVTSITAAWARIRAGGDVLAPKEGMGLAGNFLFMLTGKKPSPEHERIFDISLTLHADHEFNASTFASRVTVSTLSDVYSGITSGIGALKGPLHGGANKEAIVMMRGIASKKVDVKEHVRGMLQRKERIMGIGHRVYRLKDPRAYILEEFAKKVANPALYRVAKDIEEVMAKDKNLYPNVDFFSGMVYEALGIRDELFTLLFAMSRTAGWLAHMMEQLENNRLIRPLAAYVGETDRAYVPIGKRG